MSSAREFHKKTLEVLQYIMDTQMDAMDAAAALVADTIAADGLIRPFGTGHSHLIATEMYQRAGGFGAVMPLLEGNLMMHEGGLKSGTLERLPGYAAALLSVRPVEKRDLLIVISQSGRNAAPIEMTLECKKRGMKTIAITSLAHSQSTDSRHESGKRLFEIVDVALDNGCAVGDAALTIDPPGITVASLSNIAGMFIWHTVSAIAVEKLAARGIKPLVFMSGNAPGGDLNNVEIFQKYRDRVLF